MTGTEMAKQRRRRSFFFEKYPRGKGIDIGCGPHALNKHVVRVDIKNFKGLETRICDATYMKDFESETFDYVYSSHCLEHLNNVVEAIQNWYRILKVGGYLIIIVPHRDYYEKERNLPSIVNKHHKHFFLPFVSEMPDTISLCDLIKYALESPKIIYLNECCETVLPYRKVLPEEIEKLKIEAGAQPDFSIEAIIQKKVYTPMFEFKK